MRKLLKRNEVIAIRRQYAASHTIQEIATAYGRAWETIADCVHGRTYARVKDVLVPPLPEPTPRFRVPVARGVGPGATRVRAPRQLPSPQPPGPRWRTPGQRSRAGWRRRWRRRPSSRPIPALRSRQHLTPQDDLTRLLPISCRIVTFPLTCPLQPTHGDSNHEGGGLGVVAYHGT